MSRTKFQTLSLAGLCSAAVLAGGLIEGAVRDADGDRLLFLAGGAFVFFGILSVQLMRPTSFRLACSLAVMAIVAALIVPLFGTLTMSTADYSAINAAAAGILLAFTYSLTGWVALAAGTIFVVVLVARGIVVVARPTPSADTVAEDS